jgi:hypothetical protein
MSLFVRQHEFGPKCCARRSKPKLSKSKEPRHERHLTSPLAIDQIAAFLYCEARLLDERQDEWLTCYDQGQLLDARLGR